MAGNQQASKSKAGDNEPATLGSKDNPLFVKHVYDETDQPILADPRATAEGLDGVEWAREEARCQAQTVIINAERIAQAALMNPNVRVLLRGEPLDPTIRIEGKTQGAHLARQAYNFAKDYEHEMQLILLEEMDKAAREYTAAEVKDTKSESGSEGEGQKPDADANTKGDAEGQAAAG